MESLLDSDILRASSFLLCGGGGLKERGTLVQSIRGRTNLYLVEMPRGRQYL